MLASFEELPLFIAIKDLSISDGIPRYSQMTAACAQLLGWKKIDQALGQTDYDVPSDIASGAPGYIEIDQLCISQNRKIQTFEFWQKDNKWQANLVEKHPVHRHQVLFQCTNITHTSFGYMALQLFKKHPHKRIWLLGQKYANCPLSNRQQECLFYLIHGKNTKEMARLLNLSPRTVESHLEKIRLAFRCSTKNQVVEKAFDEGFAYFVPSSLLNTPILL